jgi:lysophospholipase L1-like esterase
MSKKFLGYILLVFIFSPVSSHAAFSLSSHAASTINILQTARCVFDPIFFTPTPEYCNPEVVVPVTPTTETASPTVPSKQEEKSNSPIKVIGTESTTVRGSQGIQGPMGPQGPRGERGPAGSSISGDFVTKTQFDNQLNGIFNSIESSSQGLSQSIKEGVNTDLLAVSGNATVGGNLTVTGTMTGTIVGNATTATALQTARTIGGVSFDGTANITVASATGGFTVSGGALALGTNDLTMTGSLGTTGARLTKGWFTDLEVTNAITGSITGNAGTVTNGVYTNAANSMSVINPLTTLAESWIGPSSTTGIYFKGDNIGIGTTTPRSALDVQGNLNVFAINSFSFSSIQNDTTVVFEGDSITAGYGLNPGEDWPSVLQTLPAFKDKGQFINSSFSGSSVASLVSRYSTSVQPYKPVNGSRSILMVMVGTNDIARDGNNAVSTFNALNNYLETAKADGFEIWLFTLIDRSDSMTSQKQQDYQTYNKLIRQSVVWDKLIDVAPLLPDATDSVFFLDGRHPTALGARKIAEYVDLLSNLSTSPVRSMSDVINADNGKFNTLTVSGVTATTTLAGDLVFGNISNDGSVLFKAKTNSTTGWIELITESDDGVGGFYREVNGLTNTLTFGGLDGSNTKHPSFSINRDTGVTVLSNIKLPNTTVVGDFTAGVSGNLQIKSEVNIANGSRIDLLEATGGGAYFQYNGLTNMFSIGTESSGDTPAIQITRGSNNVNFLGRTGIGIASASASLHVYGGASGKIIPSMANGGALFENSGSLNTSIILQTLTAAGSGLTVTNAGNVGIGDITTPTDLLHINTGNLRIGNSTAVRATTAGTNQLILFDGTAPVGTLTDGISLYSTAGELRVMDAAGNATLLSPHENENNYWVFNSVNEEMKKSLIIDMELMMKDINDQFGLNYVHETLDGVEIEREVSSSLFDKIFDKISIWLSQVENKISDIFADRIHIKELCVVKSDGTEICASGDQLEEILLDVGGNSKTFSPPPPDLVTDIVPTTEEVSEKVPEILEVPEIPEEQDSVVEQELQPTETTESTDSTSSDFTTTTTTPTTESTTETVSEPASEEDSQPETETISAPTK